MLETLTQGFRNARARLKGYRQIDESNIQEALDLVKTSLLEGDVEYHVALSFLDRVKEAAVGELVLTRAEHKGREMKVTPADHFIKICHDKLVELMGAEECALVESKTRPVTTIMVVGLQGSGKTTTAAKLAHNLARDGRKPMLVAADVYRPAAVEQLMILGERANIPVFHVAGSPPPELCRTAVEKAVQEQLDVVIFDTAGRLAIDEPLMKELEEIDRQVYADNIFLVVDAMIGQDAVNTAREFNRRLELDGVILTKLDGDARGGAALSIRAVTGKPIRYVGMGEGLDRLEPFRPEGLASRILGFGDVVGLMQDFEKVVDAEKAEEEARKMLKGDFNFLQFLEQIRMIKQVGPLQDVMDKLPFFPDGMPKGMTVDENALVRIEAMIQSMTPQERLDPSLLDDRRIKRIARGAGRTEKEVHEMMGRFTMMRQMMKAVGKQPGLLARIPGFKQLAQAQALKDMKMEDMLPLIPESDPEEQRRGRQQISAAELLRRRKKAKEARKQRKKQKKAKKGKR
jgi:signal recognition particle subunit SRP54